VVSRADTLGGEVVGKLVRPPLHLRIGPPDTIGNEVLALGKDVDGVLEQVGQVELHRR